jgi:hypothetical protein
MLLLVLSAASIFLWDVPWARTVLFPVRTFVTTVHEMGHALACLATGGTVSGMTIVADGEGHGGLTFCAGGIPFIYTQTGYLGAAFFGCLLIFIGRYRKLSRVVLALMGVAVCAASLVFMTGTVFHGNLFQGVGSVIWGFIIGCGLIWSGFKLNDGLANFILLFLATQTALNSLTDVVVLIKLSLGMLGSASSDAGSMAQMTFLPAAFWSVLWGAISLAMLSGTLWLCYGPKGRS